MVNDGSPDTPELEKVLAAFQDRIVYIKQPNKRAAGARNTAIAQARGEFLAFLDSDDLWEPQYLERQLSILASRPDVDLVTGNGWFLGGTHHGRTVRPYPDSRPPITLETIISDEQAVYVMTVFRRRVYETIGGFDERVCGNEDFEYWLRAAVAGFRDRAEAAKEGRCRTTSGLPSLAVVPYGTGGAAGAP